MGSQQTVLNLQRAGAVAGFYPPDVPREERDELDPPINVHKSSDNIEPTPEDTRSELPDAEQGTTDDESLARPVAAADALTVAPGDVGATTATRTTTRARTAKKASARRR
jgi:hypothetical protein